MHGAGGHYLGKGAGGHYLGKGAGGHYLALPGEGCLGDGKCTSRISASPRGGHAGSLGVSQQTAPNAHPGWPVHDGRGRWLGQCHCGHQHRCHSYWLAC